MTWKAGDAKNFPFENNVSDSLVSGKSDGIAGRAIPILTWTRIAFS
jgi:hypothetical protein